MPRSLEGIATVSPEQLSRIVANLPSIAEQLSRVSDLHASVPVRNGRVSPEDMELGFFPVPPESTVAPKLSCAMKLENGNPKFFSEMGGMNELDDSLTAALATLFRNIRGSVILRPDDVLDYSELEIVSKED